MSFQAHWRRGQTGWFPIPAGKASCLYCHEPLKKLHGLNRNRDEREPTVMGLFLFGAGPWCIHCGTKAWTDPDFWTRSGANEYAASNWDLNRDFRAKMPSAEDDFRKVR